MTEDHNDTHIEQVHFKLFKTDFKDLTVPMLAIFWVLVGVISKLVFNSSRKVSQIFPDSSLLLVLGLVVGCILHFTTSEENNMYALDSGVFFHYLLPPIVLDAGYFMPNRLLFLNIGTVVTFAVIGTVANMLVIGLCLWALGYAINYIPGQDSLDLIRIFIFTSLISAVDPVAVLAVFEEIQVNKTLYISVFGESLFNDAVTMVLYHMMQSYYHIKKYNPLSIVDILLAPVSFIYVAVGGIVIGVVFAFITSFFTKFTSKIRLLEPLLVLSLAYASYTIAQGFELSSILAIVCFGQFVRQYVSLNLHPKSKTTLNYFIKTLSTCSETIIFIYLGLSAWRHNHTWSFPFIALTLFLCLFVRALVVLIQCFFLNKTRLPESRFSFAEQIIMAYGGLRGAIAYGLAASIHVQSDNDNEQNAKNMFLTTTIIVVLFTVFVQGTTIKPLVGLMKVKKHEEREEGFAEKTFSMLQDNVAAILESVIGTEGHKRIILQLDRFNENVLWPILLSSEAKKCKSRANLLLQKSIQREQKLMQAMMKEEGQILDAYLAAPSRPVKHIPKMDEFYCSSSGIPIVTPENKINVKELDNAFRKDKSHIDSKALRHKIIAGDDEKDVKEGESKGVEKHVTNRRASQDRLSVMINKRYKRDELMRQQSTIPEEDEETDPVHNFSSMPNGIQYKNPAFETKE